MASKQNSNGKKSASAKKTESVKNKKQTGGSAEKAVNKAQPEQQPQPEPQQVQAQAQAEPSQPVQTEPKKTQKGGAKKADSKATKPAKKTGEKVAKKAGGKTAKKAGTKPAKKAGGKVAKKSATKKTASSKSTSKSAKKSAPKKDAKQTGGNTDDTESENSRTRYFKVMVEGGDAHGRFSGSKPKQAANKALTSILKSREKDGKGTNGEIKFTIVECTRGSKHKSYNYVGQRVKLDDPMKVTIGAGPEAKVIEYKFNNKVMKDKTVQAPAKN